MSPKRSPLPLGPMYRSPNAPFPPFGGFAGHWVRTSLRRSGETLAEMQARLGGEAQPTVSRLLAKYIGFEAAEVDEWFGRGNV